MTWALEDQLNKPSQIISVVWQTVLGSPNCHRALDKYCVKVVFCSACAIHSSCPRICRLISPANTDSSHSIRQSQSVFGASRSPTYDAQETPRTLALKPNRNFNSTFSQPPPPGPESNRNKVKATACVHEETSQNTQTGPYEISFIFHTNSILFFPKLCVSHFYFSGFHFNCLVTF